MKENESGIEKQKPPQKSAHKVNFRWALFMLLGSFCISFAFSGLSDYALSSVNLIAAFCILGAFILLGILFDILGVATTSASERPLHAMAARKVPGSKEAIWLLHNAEKVASFCNDVVGDIAGIISGATAAVIIARLPFVNIWISLTITSLVAGITVGGKALGKGMAINYSNQIVFAAGRFLHFFKRKDR